MIRGLCALALLLIGCGGSVLPGPTAYAPRSRPGPVVDLHPECADATEQGPLVALGCRPGCVPRVRPQVVCIDDPPVLLGLLPGERAPALAAVWDARGECTGWRIFRLHGCRTYTNFLIQWAKHPSQPGDWCNKANDLPLDQGYFERAPYPDRPLSGGGGREFCFFEEFTPNE